jgi:hypothetical protein
MTHDHHDHDLVRISLPGPNAVSAPILLIKVGDVYYATLSVWEYNPAHAVTCEEKEGYRQVDEYFRRHESSVVGHAITLKIGDPITMTSTTNPPHPKPTPTRPPHHEPRDPNGDPSREPTGEPQPKDTPPVRET